MENVKNLVGKKFKADFDKWLDYLEGLGYTNYWKVLNAKHYGVPQNRERVFVISILGEHEPYKFPDPVELTTRVKDFLDDNVPEKYYLKQEMQEKFPPSLKGKLGAEPQLEMVGMLDIKGNECIRRVYSEEGLCPSLTTMQGGNRQPKVMCRKMECDTIRKLTPKECFRLMGLADTDIEKIQATGISNAQQYKMAGNSIVVDVLEAIFKNLF